MHKAILRASALALLVMFVALAGPAGANEPGASDESSQLVREAIALIVNTPGDMEAIEDRIADAQTAPDQEGVDLALVAEAAAALPGGDMHVVRALLERSIGAQPHVGTNDPLPIGQSRGTPGMAMATGAETGTDVVTDPLPPDRDRSGGDWLALAGLAVLAAAGVALAARLRPRLHPTQEAAQ